MHKYSKLRSVLNVLVKLIQIYVKPVSKLRGFSSLHVVLCNMKAILFLFLWILYTAGLITIDWELRN